MVNQLASHAKLQAEIIELLVQFGPSSIFALARRTHHHSDTIKADVEKLNNTGKVICVRLPDRLLVSVSSEEIEKRRKLDEFYSQKAEKE